MQTDHNWTRQSMSKSGPKKFADGGEANEAALKAEGLAASQGDRGSLWDRIKAGNIDDPKSEAYSRWGAGRGLREREAKNIADEAEAVGKTYRARPQEGGDSADASAKVPDVAVATPVKMSTVSPVKSDAQIRSQYYNDDGSPTKSEYADTQFGDNIDTAMSRGGSGAQASATSQTPAQSLLMSAATKAAAAKAASDKKNERNHRNYSSRAPVESGEPVSETRQAERSAKPYGFSAEQPYASPGAGYTYNASRPKAPYIGRSATPVQGGRGGFAGSYDSGKGPDRGGYADGGMVHDQSDSDLQRAKYGAPNERTGYHGPGVRSRQDYKK